MRGRQADLAPVVVDVLELVAAALAAGADGGGVFRGDVGGPEEELLVPALLGLARLG